jgi:hypothetical protein
VILSQFPHPHGLIGRNDTRPYTKTVKSEDGRSPDHVYRVYVRNDEAFDKVAAAHRAMKTWSFAPSSKNQTNCSYALSDALSAGGLPYAQLYGLTPNALDQFLDMTSTSDGSEPSFVEYQDGASGSKQPNSVIGQQPDIDKDAAPPPATYDSYNPWKGTGFCDASGVCH